MKKTLLLAVSCLALSASLASAQGFNFGGQAYLSWSRDATVRDITTACGDVNLYLKLSNIHEIKGCEFRIIWSPDEATTGMVLGGVFFPTSNTGCTYLMRGTVITVEVSPDDGSSYAVAGAGSGITTECDFGNVAVIALNFDGSPGGCASMPISFSLAYVRVTDSIGVINNMSIIGAATILGATPVEPSTWGSIKSLYKN
jgi:hypothetical protein